MAMHFGSHSRYITCQPQANGKRHLYMFLIAWTFGAGEAKGLSSSPASFAGPPGPYMENEASAPQIQRTQMVVALGIASDLGG